MNCRDVEIKTPEGYKKDVTICKNVKYMPKKIQGAAIPAYDLVLINEDLEYPELYVEIHELNHLLYPCKSEYEIRRMSDEEYKNISGRHIDTANEYLEYIKRSSLEKWN